MKLFIVCIALFGAAYFATGFLAQSSAEQSVTASTKDSTTPESSDSKITSSTLFMSESHRLRVLEASGPDEVKSAYEAALGNYRKSSEIARRWAKIDPEGLWAYLKSQPDPEEERSVHESAFHALISVWCRADPQAALAAFENLPDRFLGLYRPYNVILANVAGADPALAAKYALSLPDAEFTLYSPGFSNPDEIARAFAKLPPSKFTISGIEKLATAWASQDPLAVAEWAKGLEWHLRQPVLAKAGEKLVENDLEAARELFDAADIAGKARGRLGLLIARKMSEDDPIAAIQWANENLSGEPRRDSVRDVIQILAKDNPQECVKLLESLPPDGMRDSAASMIAFQWFQSDRAAALAWSDSLDDELRKITMGSIASMWMHRDKEGALKYALENEEAFDAINSNYMLRAHSEKDIWERLAWSEALPDEAQYLKNLEKLVKAWTYRNLQQASDYASGLEGKPRSTAIQAVARHYFYQSEKRAMEWAQAFSSEADRASIVEGIRKTGIRSEDKERLIQHFQ